MSQTPETGQPAKKRRWLQYHLSTAIVMMFVAGGLLGMQFWPRSDRCFGGCLSYLGAFNVESYGWPLPVLWCFSEHRDLMDRHSHWTNTMAVANVIFGALLVLAAAFICEWFIRRRERKP